MCTPTSQSNKLAKTHRQRLCLLHQYKEEGCSRNSLVTEGLEGLHLHHLFQGSIMGDCLYPLQYQAHASGLHVIKSVPLNQRCTLIEFKSDYAAEI